MADMIVHIGHAAASGGSESRWGAPIKAVRNEDGTYSLSVSLQADGDGAGRDAADIKALLIDIKAELVKLNANTSVEVDIL